MKTGTILEHIDKDQPNIEVVGKIGKMIAVKEFGTYRSYARVATGLSDRPDEIAVIHPISWYILDELLKIYKVKYEKQT